MTVNIDEKTGVFIKEAHKAFAEPNELCRCGGRLKRIKYLLNSAGYTDCLDAGEKERRSLKVCEDCGALYAMPEVEESDARNMENSIEAIAISLVRAYNDDRISFQEQAQYLAKWFEVRGNYDLADYVVAQFGGEGTFSTMEIDPLEKIARDMYATIEELADEDTARDYELRLCQYFPDFYRRVRERGA